MHSRHLNWVLVIFILCTGATAAYSSAGADSGALQKLRVRISWGHQAAKPTPFYIKLTPASNGVEIQNAAGESLETGEGLKGDAWQTSAGNGDVDAVTFNLCYPARPQIRFQSLHVIWSDLIAQSDGDTARRLSQDPAFYQNQTKLTVQMNPEGTRGFTVTAEQLAQNKAVWIPSLDVYLAAGDAPVPFAEHQKELAPLKGSRILDRIQAEPEGSYQQYTSRWEDMGSPAYHHPNQPEPGHIVGLTWDSAIPKFGIDRGAGVWNDYGNPDHFRFWFEFADLAKGIESTWKSQTLRDGLPVITTVFEKDKVRYEVEQFAYPLNGPPKERRGDIAMTLLQKVKATNLDSQARDLVVSMTHRRQLEEFVNSAVQAEKTGDATVLKESAYGSVLFCVQGAPGGVQYNGIRDYQRAMRRINATVTLKLPAGGSQEFVVKLPTPMTEARDQATLVGIDYETAKSSTLKFWSDYVARGAQFRVPEKIVNDLFRATLWHALRLPRRHGGQEENVTIDLPYSSFAYSQTGTPWPVNQAVYVDYMLYDLRGYPQLSVEELLAMYRTNQEQNGHINGFANWVVYTPGMLYVVAKNYLLARDRALLDKLMPYSMKALDWCLAELNTAGQGEGPTSGLVYGPLNDGTGNGVWGFNQAYMYAGLDLFGQVLQQIGHPRAQECLEASRKVYKAIERGFGNSTMRSTLVQLRDHTWIPYVPCEALTHHRILDQWYVADVDTGSVHLPRLKAIAPNGEMADWLLNDHEDNLYLKGWGMANEPVYNQQATAYLLRDDPKAAIRAFYSYMACAFSHSGLDSVEHRWTHGQYFGPPSTDGAWFELYRNMLVQEWDNNTLLLCQATPRKWLEDGKKIEVERAPTYFGTISVTVESQAGSGKITANLQVPERNRPDTILVRLRHPESKPIQSVTVNGQSWTDFDKQKEWVKIPRPTQSNYKVVASY
jgi:hypothetical protein